MKLFIGRHIFVSHYAENYRDKSHVRFFEDLLGLPYDRST
jgi:hypothetical protein